MFYRTRNALVWLTVAAMLALLTWVRLDCAFPVFTLVALIIPAVALIRGAMPADLGLRPLSPRDFGRYAAANLLLLLGIMALLELLSGCCSDLLALAVDGSITDSAYAWLGVMGGSAGLIGMAVYGSGVVILAQEVFFRGWLLEKLLTHMSTGWAVALQMVFFVLTTLPVALALPWSHGLFYLLAYQGFARGLVSGWVASRTHSIWPGFCAAVVANLVLTFFTL